MFSGLERSDKKQRWFWASAATVLALLALSASAIPYQHKTSHKLRATAMVEVTTDPKGNVATRVFPITILADGNFRDAGVYESRPRPMALGNGVVYEAQKTGVPVGYVTILNGSNTPQGWVAQGKWQSATQVEARAKPKPSPTPTALPDDRPILHREGQNPQPTPTPAQTPQTSTPSDDSDRPVLHRSTDNNPQATPSPTPPTPSSSDDSDRPVLHRSTDSNPQATPTPTPSATQPTTQAETEQPAPEDPNRPVLRHRKPGNDEAENPPPQVPSKSTASASPPHSAPTPAPPVTTSAPGTQTFLAVSDVQSSDTRSYVYQWKAGEEEQIAAKMRKLALAQLPGEHAPTAEASLTNVVVRSFDLDLSNDAVVVITAESPGGFLLPAGKAARGTSAAKSAENQQSVQNKDKSVSRYVTVIARVDIDGNPQKLAASVTDSSRLDVAPRLELVDAVDVDGDGIGELVFREYDFDQKSFIIYGVGHGTVTKLFEGASEPLKP